MILKKYKLYIILLITLIIQQLTYAQQEVAAPLLSHLWQTSETNPATRPIKKWNIALPGIAGIGQSSLALNDFIAKNADGDAVFNFAEAINKTEKYSSLNAQIAIPTLAIAYNINDKWTVGLGHSIHYSGQMDAPKGTFQLLWDGNGKHIGETLQVAPKFDLQNYQSYYLQGAFKSKKLTVGTKLKYLQGKYDLSTTQSDVSIYTSDDVYQLDITADIGINSANYINYLGFTDTTGAITLPDFQRVTSPKGSNSGFAVDLGARYQINEKLEVGASIVNLGGKINWKSATNLRSKGTFAYDGFYFPDIVELDSFNFSNTLDSLQTTFDFKTTTLDYSTKLPLRFSVTANYKTGKWNLGALIGQERIATTEYSEALNNTYAGLSANYRVAKWFNIGLSYAYQYKRFDNIGLNATLKFGTGQLFFVTDKIISAFQPFSNRIVGGRAGLNIAF